MVQQELKQEHINATETLLDEDRTQNLIEKLTNKSFRNNFSFYKLKTLFFGIEDLYYKLKEVYESAEIEKYIENSLDIEALREIYNKQKLYKEYPNLDFEKLKELYDNPPTSLKSPAYKNHITYDKIVSRKYIIAIIQMIFNKMDLIVCFCGKEGTGKTTASTQDAYLVYYILSEIKIIEYEFKLKDIMYYNLKTMIDGFNKYTNVPFRISILDEGNELNRKDWGNPLVQLFFQKLRRERKHLRIVFINLPQLGELMPSITLSRVNFVFQLSMKVDLKRKLADKGKCYFYIIPRLGKIYSYLNKKILYDTEIVNEFGKILDDKKKYLQTLPKNLAIHKFDRNGVWAFNEDKYDRESKKANEAFSTTSVTLTKTEIYFLAKYMNLKKMGVKPNTNAYFMLNHLKNKKLNIAVNNDDTIKMIGKGYEDNDKEFNENNEE